MRFICSTPGSGVSICVGTLQRLFEQNMSQLQFITSDADYSIREFYELSKNDLPKVVKVTQGYCGEVSLEIFDRDQVFRIHTYSTQKRVVAELKGGSSIAGFHAHFISIPVKYNMQFCVVGSGQKSSKDETLEEILDKCKLPVDVEFSKKSGDSTFKIGSVERSSSQVIKLRLIDTYEDNYLLGNAISEGSLYGKVSAMPVYLPDLRLSVVTGLKEPFDDRYQAILNQMDNQVEQHVKFDPNYGNEDIAVYSPEEVGGHVNYAYVPPTEYYNLSEMFNERPKSKKVAYEELKQENIGQGNVYDIIPADKNIYQTISDHSSIFSQENVLNAIYGKPAPSVLPKLKPSAKHPVPPKPSKALPPGTFEKPPLRPVKNASFEDNTSDVRKPQPKPPMPLPETTEKEKQAVVNPMTTPSPPKRHSQETEITENTPKRNSAENLVISELSIEDLGEWLDKLRLDKYREEFEENQIDGYLLLELNEEILKKDFNMTSFEAIKLMKFARTGHVPKSRSGVAATSNV